MSGRRMFVKVCGITSVADSLIAAEAGADALGFVFWPSSPRYLEPGAARRIAAALPAAVVRVGVFVDAPRGQIARLVEDVGLDVVQLHGGEPPEELANLPRRAWKAVSVEAGFTGAAVMRYAQCAAAILVDSRVEATPGGTGRVCDWRLARQARERARFLILAGGLTPENVAQGIAAVEPDGVDVSSGVEASPGRKDAAKLRAFLDAARSAS